MIEELLTCKLCGMQMKGLSLHIQRTHQMKPKHYLELFPDEKMFSDASREKMRTNSFMATQLGISLDDRIGKENADRVKQILSDKRKLRVGWKHKPESRLKMRETWATNRDTWTEAIRLKAREPEQREKHRINTRKHIAENGYHLARGRKTKLELLFEQILTAENIEFVSQKGLRSISNPKIFRFYDILIPSLGILVELDGEYWHCREDRIIIDEEKNDIALVNGFSLLRISDKEVNLRNHDELTIKEVFLRLLKLDSESLRIRSNSIISDRKRFLGILE